MKELYNKMKSFLIAKRIKKTIKFIVFFFLGLFSLLLISTIGLRIYFEQNKAEITTKINTQINENIQGEVKINDIGYKFLLSFPNFSLNLHEIEIKDDFWHIHKRSFLKADKIEIRLNLLSLLKNEINIHKIVIHNAVIDLFKDKKGNANSDIFKPKKNKKTTENTTATSIDEIDFHNVTFISENQNRKKLFHFEIKSLKSKVNFDSENWKTNVKLEVFAKSMVFNTDKGSFIKNKLLQGNMAIDFSSEKNEITVITDNLKIGNDLFHITAHFILAKTNALFNLDIQTKILWKNASGLLANNISSRLNRFDLQIPLQTNCIIKGDMNAAGDPEIIVNITVNDDELTTSYGVIKKCSFEGKFTNNFKKGLPFSDANSAVIINNFKGELHEIPFSIPLGIINNFDKTIATGKFNSAFDVVKLKGIIDNDLIRFSEGKANVDLDFKVNIVDLKLNKPHFTGNIDIKNTSFYYKPKNINFQKTNIDLHFTEEALLIKKIKLQSGKNTVSMEGRVDNFLNLYYDAPEKMNVNWKVYSPYLDIKQLVGILSYYDKKSSVKTKNKSSDNQLQKVFKQSKVSLNLLVDKMTFNKMTGSNFKVNITATNNGLFVKNGSMQGNAGSSIVFDVTLIPKNNSMLFKSDIKLKDGVISNFLESFNNFGIKSFTPHNIKGKLSFTTSLSGLLDSKRDLIHESVTGNFNFHIKDGALIDFEPIQKIGKIAFQHRDVSHINFSTLNGITTIKGNKINVKEFKVTSNVLNLDVNGVYALSDEGTHLDVKIPLRNPKNDYKITDENKREKQRYKGIVLNLSIVDDDNGKIKIKLGKSD